MTKPFFTVSSLLPTLSSNHQCSLFGGGQKGGWYAFNVLHHILAATLCDEFIVCRHVLCMEPEASGETQKFRWVRDSSCSLPSFPCRQQQIGAGGGRLRHLLGLLLLHLCCTLHWLSPKLQFRMSNTQLMASPLNACADSSFRAERLFKVFLSEEILEQGEYVWRV